MSDAITELDAIINDEAWYDFFIASFDGETLVVHGTLDESYGHNLEVTFHDVSYIDAPAGWKTRTGESTVFKVMAPDELDAATRARYFDRASGTVFGFRAELFDGDAWAHVCAASMTFEHKGKWDSWAWYDKSEPPPLAG